MSAAGPNLQAARARIEGHVWRTPVFRVAALDEAVGRELWLKPEALQRTGSFKLRGATNAIRALGPDVAGVVAESSGNHAQAVARAARDAGLPAAIVMPADSNRAKVRATAAYGAEVIQDGVDGRTRGPMARALADERGWHLVHPFDDWDVISGQATATLELLEDAPPLDAVVTPVGGGGLLSGAALACAALSPATAVYGAEPAIADDVHRSLAAGRRIALDEPPVTIADGVRTMLHGERPFSVLRERCAGVALVSEQAIREALALVWSRTKLLIEPTSALPVAAVMAGDVPGRRIGIVLSGGNLDASALAELIDRRSD
jgi:threonine dehydratase